MTDTPATNTTTNNAPQSPAHVAPLGPPPFPLGWAVRYLLAVSIPAAGVSAAAVWMAGHREQWGLIGIAFGCCVLGGVVAMLMVRRAARGEVSQLLMTMLAGTGLRVFFAAGGGAVAVMAMGYPKRATGLWLILAYLVVLAVEVAVFSNYIMMLTPSSKRSSSRDDRAVEEPSQDPR